MILGGVDQIGRKGNIVYSSSCSLSLFLSLCIPTKEKFTYEKNNNFQNNFRTTFSSQIYYMYLTYKKKTSSHLLLSSPSLSQVRIKYFHHRYLLVSFQLSFPVYSRYLPPRFETYLFVSILESRPNGDFLKHLLIRQSNPSEHTCYLK